MNFCMLKIIKRLVKTLLIYGVGNYFFLRYTSDGPELEEWGHSRWPWIAEYNSFKFLVWLILLLHAKGRFEHT